MLTANLFSWLGDHLVDAIKSAAIWVCNTVIQACADLINFVLSHLPNMPTPPSFSGGYLTWVSYGQYWFPVTYMLTLGASLLTIWVAWMVISIPLRWAKAIRGSE